MSAGGRLGVAAGRAGARFDIVGGDAGAVFAAGVGLAILGIPAALANQYAPRWFGVFVAAIFALALVIISNHALEGDLSWKRVYRDAAAALLGFVPYLNLLWFRVLGYRVVVVGR